MRSPAPLRIGIAVHTFPVLTETFILEPVVRLLERGHELEIVALYAGDRAAAHPAIITHGLLEKTRFLVDDRPGRGRLRKILRGGKAVLGRRARLPWRAILRDVAAPPVARVAPELILSAIGAAAAGGREVLTYDVVHAHIGRAALVMQYLRDWGLLKGPLLATFHGSDVTVEPRRQARGYYHRLFSGATALTTNTEFLRGRLLALGAPPDRTSRLPVGVDTNVLPFRARTLVKGERVRILTVARLSHGKGLSYGIYAIGLLRERGVDVSYTIVGEGPDRAALESLVDTLRLGDLVTFTGPLTWDGVLDAYASHHLFMLPAVVGPDGVEEAQGKVLVEAQAGGLPVVATRVGGIPETVGPGAGFLVAPASAAALADALESLVRDPGSWPELGRHGRAHVEEHLDNERLTEQLLERYRGMADA